MFKTLHLSKLFSILFLGARLHPRQEMWINHVIYFGVQVTWDKQNGLHQP